MCGFWVDVRALLLDNKMSIFYFSETLIIKDDVKSVGGILEKVYSFQPILKYLDNEMLHGYKKIFSYTRQLVIGSLLLNDISFYRNIFTFLSLYQLI